MSANAVPPGSTGLSPAEPGPADVAVDAPLGGGELRDETPGPPWHTLTQGRAGNPTNGVSTARILLQVGLAALILIAMVAAGGIVVSRRTAERDAVNGAAQATDLLAETVVQPALENGLLSATPAAALHRLDNVVRAHLLNHAIVRVKVWSPDGEIIYSDEAQLIGQSFTLGADERESLTERSIHAEVTDVSRPENTFERNRGKLLEVYRPVWTPNGRPLLFETYTPYDAVSKRTTALWRGFAGIVVSSLLLLVVLLLPVLWALLDRLRRGQQQREMLLQRAVDASAEERRRIAGTLHDGVVQELAATSFTVTAAAEHADALGQPQLATRLHKASATVRGSIGGLRSLLVDIYPPSLRTAGLVAALTDLVGTIRSGDVHVRLDVSDGTSPSGLSASDEQLVFRVAQECLRNAARHAAATTIEVRLLVDGSDVVLEVDDDGVGFDIEAVSRRPAEGHFGMRLLPDLADQAGARLQVATAPGRGTRWRLTVARR